MADTAASANAATDGTDVLRERHLTNVEIPDTKTQQVLDVIHGLNINSLAGLRKFARHASMQRRAAEGGLEQRYIDAIVREYGLDALKNNKKKKKASKKVQAAAAAETTQEPITSAPESVAVTANESAEKTEKKTKRASVRSTKSVEPPTENKKSGTKNIFGRVKSKGAATPSGEPDAEQVLKRGLNDPPDASKTLEPKMTKLQLLQQKQKKSNRTSMRLASRGSSSSLGSTRSAMSSIRNLPIRAVDAVVGGVDALWMNVNGVPK